LSGWLKLIDAIVLLLIAPKVVLPTSVPDALGGDSAIALTEYFKGNPGRFVDVVL